MATTRVTLGLVQSDPNDEYQYEYRYPSDCQYIVRIVSGFITDNRQTELQFKIMRDATGRVIWTNVKDAELEYQFIETDESRHQADAVLAFSYKLAELIAPRVTAGDPFGLGEKARMNYERMKLSSFANSLNEQMEEEPPQSEFIRAQFGDTLYDRGSDWTAYPDNKDIF
tara:strand:+ start:140 stop:649 length:510 start_codon:yes stop_codon:yes gene_type:complete